MPFKASAKRASPLCWWLPRAVSIKLWGLMVSLQFVPMLHPMWHLLLGLQLVLLCQALLLLKQLLLQ